MSRTTVITSYLIAYWTNRTYDCQTSYCMTVVPTFGGPTMGRIITVASSKGGCSKSSIIMILAGNLSALGYQTAVVDADPNACFFQWHKLYEGPKIECFCEVRQEEIVDLTQAKAAEFDIVLIDTAGFG